jgi:hypothetical protein
MAIQPVVAMPMMSLQEAVARRNAMVGFVQQIMIKGSDYGEIPGSTKPTLLKPGAEKLVTFFGLTPRFTIVKETENWGADGAEPFFYYWFRCGLWRGANLVGEGDGSCNSHEVKYRYRQGSRKCPTCGKETIIKGKAEYGGGWLCFVKKGGCGAKFADGDQAIEGQQIGRILNPDVADIANTVLKMAQKRALVAATLISVNASEFFTQDIEDMDAGTVIEGQATTIPGAAAKHWIDNPPDQRKFWAWVKSKDSTLTVAEVHKLLGVEHIHDLKGSIGDAMNAIVAALAAATKTPNEPVQEPVPA